MTRGADSKEELPVDAAQDVMSGDVMSGDDSERPTINPPSEQTDAMPPAPPVNLDWSSGSTPVRMY